VIVSDADFKQNVFTYLDPIAKAIGLIAGILYLCGFAIVAGHLSRYGVSSFSVIQLQYLIAGTLALAPPIAMMLVQEARKRFEQRAYPDVVKKFNWRRFLFSMLLGGIPFGILVTLMAASGVPSQMSWWHGIKYYLFFMAIDFTQTLCWTSWRIPKEQEGFFINRDAPPFYLSLFLCIVGLYVLWFSKNIYPLIPYSFGGGRPLTVVFIPGEKKLPDGLKLDQSSKRSVPYKLLATTDKYYVVLSQEPGQLSIELSRDYVAEMIVTAEPNKP
jgi:hypothetical protein